MKIQNKDIYKGIDLKYNLKRIPSEEIKLVYENNTWDGPLEGICDWKNERYYFICFDQLDDEGNEDRWPRKYALIKLTEEESKEEQKEYELFISSVDDPDKLKNFYEKQKLFPEYEIMRDQIIGWFDSSNWKTPKK